MHRALHMLRRRGSGRKKKLTIVKNVGNTDRFIRLLIGLAFLANVVVLNLCIIGKVVLIILGLAVLASAWKAYCPLYQYLGISTCSNECCEKQE